MMVSLAAYLISHQVADLHSTREFAAVLPFAAALAGRVLGPRLERARMVPALALLLTAYLLEPGARHGLPRPRAGQQLASWLSAHRLSTGWPATGRPAAPPWPAAAGCRSGRWGPSAPASAGTTGRR